MSSKYLAFLAVVAAGLILRMFVIDGGKITSPEASAIVLLPATLGERHITKRWHNLLGSTTIEEGALYAGGANVPAVQLDFYRNSPVRHNGVVCYMTQGETMIWDKPRVLRTHDGTAQLDVALFRGGGQLRIAAATECSVQGCAESSFNDEIATGSEVHQQSWRLQASSVRWSVVPVSVVMARTVRGADDEDAVAADMERDLETALQQIDLTPARKLAALQVVP
jgi:hypothetical protein